MGDVLLIDEVLADVDRTMSGYRSDSEVSRFNAADSTAIVEYTASSVGVDIPASVNVLKAKYDVFEDQKVVILAGLKLLKDDHDTFSAALVSNITADQANGYAAVAVIDDALQSAIDLYSA